MAAFKESVGVSRSRPIAPPACIELDLALLEGWVLQGPDGVIIDIGMADGTLLGWSLDDLVSDTAQSMLHPGDREIAAKVRDRVRAEGGSQTLHLRARAKNGRWVWVETVFHQAPSPDGRLGERTCVTVRDVSDRYLGHEAMSLLVDLRQTMSAATTVRSAWQRALSLVSRLVPFDTAVAWEHTSNGIVATEEWSQGPDPEPRCHRCLDALRSEVQAGWRDPRPRRVVLPLHRCTGRSALPSTLLVKVLGADGTVAVVEFTGTQVDDTSSAMQLVGEAFGQIGDAFRQKHIETELALARRRFELAFTEASIGMALVAPDGGFIDANDALCKLLGRSHEEIRQVGFQAVTHPDDLEADLAYVMQMLAGEMRTYQLEKRYLRPTGEVVWGLLSVSLVRDEAGNPLHFISQIQDISPRKEAERRLRQSVARFRAAFDDSALGMALVPLDGGGRGLIIEANDQLRRIFRCDDLVGTAVDRLVEVDESVFTSEDLLALTPEAPAIRVEVKAAVTDDDRWLRLVAAPVRAEDAEHGRFAVLQVEDITDERRIQAEVTHLALHDSLTGLPNRVLMMDRIERAQERSERTGHHFGVLFVDLDNFKDVNDTFGHGHGDELLIRVADRLKGGLRPNDSAARLGGDEFVVMCEDLSTDVELATNELAAIADRLHNRLAPPIVLDGDELFVSASVGSHVSYGLREPVQAVVSNADTAMYQAKTRGRSRTEVYDAAVRARAAERLAVAKELRMAIPSGQFHLAYQPIVDLADDRSVAAEALLRWTHPDLGPVGPADFIPVAEESGLIVEIGQYVLETVCAELAGVNAPTGYLTVNVSARQLSQSDFVSRVMGALDAWGVDANQLALELTESVLVEASTSSHRQLAELRDAGLRIGIDDFGTGYATLRAVRDLPVTFLKIDRSFVAGLTTDRDDLSIAKAVVGLADALSLDTVAEGVETREQADLLRELGCSHAQGYFFGRPAPLGLPTSS